MFKSAAEEISHWANRCGRWAREARSHDQKLLLQNLERVLSQAALDAEDALEFDCVLRPLASNKT
jgi:hypothetical protein